MAPRKEKSDKSTVDQGAAMILEYLRKQNRPYSPSDISANLHNKVSKVHATKFLKEMHDRKQIEGKASGKQLVYHCLQDPSEDNSPEDIARMQADVNTLREDITAARSSEKILRSELGTLSSLTSTADLRSIMEALEMQKQGLLEILSQLRTVEVKPVAEAERVAVREEHNMWQRHASARKNICRELWYRCIDLLPEDMTKEELWEQLGCEGEVL